MTSLAANHVKMTQRQYGGRVATTSQAKPSNEVKGKAKVKVSTLLSPESQKAMMLVKEEASRQR
jgi:hypothetical protein